MKHDLLSLLLFLSVIHAQACPRDGWLPEDLAASLRLKGSLTQLQTQDTLPALLPAHPILQETVSTAREQLHPKLFVESLYRYDTRKSETEATGWTATEQVALYNHVLALSSLKGIQYFSTTRKKMWTLYETSEVVDKPEQGKVRKDPHYTAPPRELTIYARQKDTTFGENTYRYTYRYEPQMILFKQENLTTMSYGFLPLIGKNKLHSIVAILDGGDHLLLYIISMGDVLPAPGMTGRIGSSFTNRADAIVRWFTTQADRVFQTQ